MIYESWGLVVIICMNDIKVEELSEKVYMYKGIEL